jgi:hypothetical protein
VIISRIIYSLKPTFLVSPTGKSIESTYSQRISRRCGPSSRSTIIQSPRSSVSCMNAIKTAGSGMLRPRLASGHDPLHSRRSRRYSGQVSFIRPEQPVQAPGFGITAGRPLPIRPQRGRPRLPQRYGRSFDILQCLHQYRTDDPKSKAQSYESSLCDHSPLVSLGVTFPIFQPSRLTSGNSAVPRGHFEHSPLPECLTCEQPRAALLKAAVIVPREDFERLPNRLPLLANPQSQCPQAPCLTESLP